MKYKKITKVSRNSQKIRMIQLEMRMITKYLKKYLKKDIYVYIYIYIYPKERQVINNIGIYAIL